MNPKHLAMTAAAMISAIIILVLLWSLSLLNLPVTAENVTTASPRYVSSTGTDSGDCTDSTSPCRTVQYAVDQAGEGSVIKVASGVYTGVSARPRRDLTTTGVVTQMVYISKTVTIRGGYAPTFADPPDLDANASTLDAQGEGRVLYITAPASGAGISPTIEGLRITGGDSAGLGGGWGNAEAGGGVYVIAAAVTLSGCRVVANTANRFVPYGGGGGGVYLRNSPNATLTGNIVQSNTAWYGGGMYLLFSDNVTLSGNTIQGNGAYGWYGASGGGVLLEDSDNVTLTGNTIQDNTAQVGGGVFLIDSDNATLSGNTIQGNMDGGSHTFFEGGGVCLWDSDNATLSGNTIQGNSSEEGGGICLRDSDNATLSGNIIRGNLGGLGSGVNMYSSDNVTLSGNTIQSNATDWWYGTSGSGVWMMNCNKATLDNNVIADNQVGTAGGGIYMAGSTAYLRHTTLARNGGGSGLCVTDDWCGEAYSTVALTNTLLVSHTVGITVTGGSTATLNGVLWYENKANTGGLGTLAVTHQITGNPAFAADGYHITPESAAVDAGVDAGVTADIDGEPRPAGKGYDIGADEVLAALRVMKQASPSLVEPGARLTYTIRATNTGFVDLHALITDVLPLSITLAETSGGTLLLPGGGIGITWTAIMTMPGGVWNETLVVTVAEDCEGPLTNLVQVTTKEGARGVYTETSGIASHSIYLPLALSNWPPMMPVSGRVTLQDGTGLAGVEVYIGNSCSHPWTVWLAATTDSEGYYAADTHCPFDHDETLRVFALLDGYAFAPEFDCWRTYGYCVGKHTDFMASPTHTLTH